jgi:hypothetical protein
MPVTCSLGLEWMRAHSWPHLLKQKSLNVLFMSGFLRWQNLGQVFFFFGEWPGLSRHSIQYVPGGLACSVL